MKMKLDIIKALIEGREEGVLSQILNKNRSKNILTKSMPNSDFLRIVGKDRSLFVSFYDLSLAHTSIYLFSLYYYGVNIYG